MNMEPTISKSLAVFENPKVGTKIYRSSHWLWKHFHVDKIIKVEHKNNSITLTFKPTLLTKIAATWNQ